MSVCLYTVPRDYDNGSYKIIKENIIFDSRALGGRKLRIKIVSLSFAT